MRADANHDDEEVVVAKPAPYSPPYLEIKIDMDYQTNRPTPRLFDKSSGAQVEVQPQSFSELTARTQLMATRRLVIHICRLHCMKSAAGNEKRPYGVILSGSG